MKREDAHQIVNSETSTLTLVYLTQRSSVFEVIIITDISYIGWFLLLANNNLQNLPFHPSKTKSFFLYTQWKTQRHFPMF